MNSATTTAPIFPEYAIVNKVLKLNKIEIITYLRIKRDGVYYLVYQMWDGTVSKKEDVNNKIAELTRNFIKFMYIDLLIRPFDLTDVIDDNQESEEQRIRKYMIPMSSFKHDVEKQIRDKETARVANKA